MVERLHTLRDLRRVERRVDDAFGKIRLMISEAHQQKRFGREVVTETGEEGGIVALAQALPPQIFLDMGRVAEVAPIRRQIRPEAVVPRKMIGGEIGENKQRAAAALALDQPCGWS